MVEHVGTREEEITGKKNSDDFCVFLSMEAMTVGTHREMHSRAETK